MSHLSHRLVGLMAQTPLHAGSGSADDVIDLPIQREAHSDWPCIFGSSVKGALRAHAESTGLDKAMLKAVFGPGVQEASEHAGSMLVSDARLVLLPVRSLTSHFRWVTCPALLRRLGRDMQRLGVIEERLGVPEVEPGQALVAQALANGADLYLEEFHFASRVADLDGWLSWLCTLCGDDDDREALKRQLTLVDDDSFRHLCRSALPVQPHIRLNNGTKTVAAGALWYEESLAPETLLYVCLSAQPPRYKPAGVPDNAAQLLDGVLNGLFGERPWLQIGGNETVGMGWCHVALPKGMAS